jgi:23S rRNA pseudouridine2457 synthase
LAFRYILFNKPYGVITQFSGAGPTLRDYIQLKDVYPVGRLDHDSEGLLLLTDDGVLQHRLTAPRFAHPRTYWVQVEGQPDERSLSELADGVLVQGIPTRPAKVRLLDEEPSLPPRNPMGDLRLEGLLAGEWRNLSDSEIALMRQLAGRQFEGR